jgi:hypothetical protein
MLRIILTALLVLISFNSHADTRIVDLPPCPAVNDDGSTLPLTPSRIRTVTSRQEDNVAVPPELRNTPLTVVGFFESGGSDPYKQVGTLDQLSIGYQQWNHGTGSLYSDFLSSLQISDIELASNEIMANLKELYEHSKNRISRSRATRIINLWKTPMPNDPLVGGVRKSVRTHLQNWLGLQKIRNKQNALIEKKLRLAYSYTRKWLADQEIRNPTSEELNLTITSFYDLLVYNGSRKGLWLQHVKSFREKFENGMSTVKYISNWLISCSEVNRPSCNHQKMYNRKEAKKNAELWISTVEDNNETFSDNQINLFVFGYLRALRSKGSNYPNGFPGIYQADVMMRRGTVALKLGTVRGQKITDIWPE